METSGSWSSLRNSSIPSTNRYYPLSTSTSIRVTWWIKHDLKRSNLQQLRMQPILAPRQERSTSNQLWSPRFRCWQRYQNHPWKHEWGRRFWSIENCSSRVWRWIRFKANLGKKAIRCRQNEEIRLWWVDVALNKIDGMKNPLIIE